MVTLPAAKSASTLRCIAEPQELAVEIPSRGAHDIVDIKAAIEGMRRNRIAQLPVSGLEALWRGTHYQNVRAHAVLEAGRRWRLSSNSLRCAAWCW
mgnify:CR=1 FL=1